MRMGLHVNAHIAHDKAIAYCRDVKPPAMKWLAPSKETLQECKRVSPNTKHIIRVYWSDQNLGSGQYVPFRSRCVEVAHEYRGLASWVEGWNEVACNEAQYLRQFCQAEVDLAKRLNDAGMGAAIGGFSTGALDVGGYSAKAVAAMGGQVPYRMQRNVVEYQSPAGATAIYDAARPMLAFLHETSGTNILHFHEYSAPYIQYGWRTPDSLNQWDHNRNTWTGASKDASQYQRAPDGWWTLRYRMLRRLLVRDGLTGVRFGITESGLDNINPRPGGQGAGWRDWTGSQWTGLPGVGNYACQMRAYGEHMSRDDYVVAWVDFGFGTADPHWNSFALDQTPDMLAAMVTEMRALPVGPVTPVPPPDPVPPPTPSGAVEARILVLPGDGYYALARRALGRNPTVPEATAMKAANSSEPLKPGAWALSPFHKAVRV